VTIAWGETPQAPSPQIAREVCWPLLDLRNLRFLKPGGVTFLYDLWGGSDEMVKRPQVEGQEAR